MNDMKPILFNGDMTRAILDNRKTVTRRVVKPQPEKSAYSPYECVGGRVAFRVGERGCTEQYKPPYRPGDILYVRETWAAWSRTEGIAPEIHYKADGDNLPGVKWRPSIHMPHEAARIFLRVTDVRVEQLDAIDGQGLIDEGLFSLDELRHGLMREKFAAFEKLWDSTIKPADRALYGWEANPWVWVIGFKRISKEEVALAEMASADKKEGGGK